MKFLRRNQNRYSKLGKKRKKKQVWRRPSGRDNKMREKRKGYPAIVSVGYRKDKKDKGKINDKKLIIINNVNDLGKIKKDELVLIGNVGKKKKIEIVKKIQEKKIPVYGLNPKKFLEKNKLKNKGKEKSKEKKEIKEKKK